MQTATKNPDEITIASVVPRAQLIFDAATISYALDVLADKLETHLKDLHPLMLCVMNGGIVFTGHLVTRLEFDLDLDYVHATRYRNQTKGGEVLNWLAEPHTSLQDRTVVILDDILDEGITLDEIIKYCKAKGAKQVISVVLLRKIHERCIKGVDCDYTALEVDDRYVFGFGMDYKGGLRHLNGIYAVDE
ncbi:MAG: hypoxanthine-guanine phosphoribosyltransferase [Gammaproteobacteria bacterium]